ncbi:MAG: hypothetical protein U5R06_24780 [candidate division KSB1 bacterium]|nr:hypothetical protein [candidate division KSB1 bacterium]
MQRRQFLKGMGAVLGTVSDELIMSTDLYPTLLDMADLPLRPDQHMDGISLASHLREQKTLERDTLFWHYPHYHNLGQKPASVIRQGDFKLIEHLKDDRVELFDFGIRRNRLIWHRHYRLGQKN